MEPRGLPSLLPVDTLHWAERFVRRLASPQREAFACSTPPCEQRAQCRHDGGVVLEDAQSPAFPASVHQRYKGLPRRFKKTVYSIDSSTITLVANCMDWARHRRRKAAAKLHLCLQTFLPSFAVIEEAPTTTVAA